MKENETKRVITAEMDVRHDIEIDTEHCLPRTLPKH